MKTVFTKLKDKLSALGYNENVINSVLRHFDLESMEKYYANNEFPEDFITVEEYEEPCVEIIQLLLNITEKIVHAEILEGDINISSTMTAVGTRVAIADYTLAKRCAVMGISSDNKAYIIIYKPSTRVQNLYKDLSTYEQNFKQDRDDITKDYFDAFVQNGRVTERKVKEILTMLIADFVIDEMAVYDINPRIDSSVSIKDSSPRLSKKLGIISSLYKVVQFLHSGFLKTHVKRSQFTVINAGRIVVVIVITIFI